MAVSACSPPESSDRVCGFLPGRLGEDVEAGLEGVVGFDQLQLGGAAAEEGREEALEVLVDGGEGGEQALAALAVERADAAAQLLDGLDQVVALADHAVELRLDLGQLVVGTQIDAAEAFALALQAVELVLDAAGVGERRIGR